jgi:translation elongation factor EF-Tu-like GTPase
MDYELSIAFTNMKVISELNSSVEVDNGYKFLMVLGSRTMGKKL